MGIGDADKGHREGTIHLYSASLSEQEKALTGVEIVQSLEDEIIKSVEVGKDRSIAIISEGPYVIPIYTP
jgi:hypothetical protein